MPLYDFKCTACGKVTEKLVPSTVHVIVCGHHEESMLKVRAAHRLMGAPGGFRIDGAQGRMVLSPAQKRMIKEPVWESPDGSIESAH